MKFDHRIGCSSISFRHQPLDQALETIAGLGFEEIDLGALPGVCDHVPFVLDSPAVAEVASTVRASGLRVRSVNGDIGDLNRPLDAGAARSRREHLTKLLDLVEAIGARALVLPCGATDHEPISGLEADLDLVAAELTAAAELAGQRNLQIWTEALHFHRLCWNLDRARELSARLEGTGIGIVMDFSHIVASGGRLDDFVEQLGDRVGHVHLRDAEPGGINLSIGRGEVDFAGGIAALMRRGYEGHFALELETRDITHEERPDAAVAAASLITTLLQHDSAAAHR